MKWPSLLPENNTPATLPAALIVGLGNPGTRYEMTRHNLGFLVVDELARSLGLLFKKSVRLEAEEVSGVCEGQKVHILKPMTYMNLSGQSVVKALHYYKIPLSRVLLVVDEVYLKLGTMRVRSEGSDGGHNGLKSVTASVGGQGYPRLRMGIGPRTEEETPRGGLEAYVLASFTVEERALLPEVMTRGSEVVRCWLREGIEAASRLAGNFSKT